MLRIHKLNYRTFLVEFLIIFMLVVVLKDIGIIISFCLFTFQILIKRKNEWLLKSLIYFFFFRFLNPILLPNSPTLTILSWFLLLIVFVKVVSISNLKDYKGLTAFFLFILLAFIASIFKSDYLGISLFKLLSFLLGFLAIFLALKQSANYPWEEFFISLWLFILVASLPTLLFPKIGFARNATGFQGITNHPQFFGPFCALMGGIAAVLFSLKKIQLFNKSIFWGLVLINFLVVFLSESRTALLIFTFLILTGVFIYLKETQTNLSRILPKLIIVILGIVLIGLFNFSSVEQKMVNFLAKDRTGSTSSLTFDQFSKSRSGLADIALQNFEENPILGIGFAAPNHYYDFNVEYLEGTSIPISASMEKGVLVTLLLEEVGSIGFLFFAGFILSFLIPVFRYNKVYLIFILGPLILNLGEATFFSTNGQGILQWSLFSLALIRSKYYPNHKLNEDLHLAVSPQYAPERIS